MFGLNTVKRGILYITIGLLLVIIAIMAWSMLTPDNTIKRADVLQENLDNVGKAANITDKYVGISRPKLIRMLNTIPIHPDSDTDMSEWVECPCCNQERHVYYQNLNDNELLDMVYEELRAMEASPRDKLQDESEVAP